MAKLESESALVWKLLLWLVSLPLIIIKILFGKEKASALWVPLKEFIRFLMEPKVTFYLIVINCVIYLFEVFYFTTEQLEAFIFQPEHVFTFNVVPIVSSWFLHASLAHLFGNMLFLMIFGRVVERNLGSGWTILVYVISGVVSSIVSALFNTGGIGASGAIAGLVSTAILLEPLYLTYLIAGIPLPLILLGFVAMTTDVTQILIPDQFDRVNHFAHLGGYLAVIPIMWIVNKDMRHRMKRNITLNAVLVLVIIVLKHFGYL